MADLRAIPWLAPTYPAGPPPGYSDLALARQVHQAGMRIGAGVGSPNVNLTLFDFQGAALPSIGIFENPARVCASYNPWNTPCIIGW